jgi:DNA-binding MarR family transcriptional regulator
MSNSEDSSTGPRGVGFLLAQIGAHAASKFGQALEALKLTPPQAGILGILGRESGLSQQALADLLGMFPSRLVAVLDDMQSAGLVERRPHRGDRRVFALHLTAAGKKALQAVGRVARQHGDELCAALNPGEREVLEQFLARIAEEQKLRPGIHPGYRRLGEREERE